MKGLNPGAFVLSILTNHNIQGENKVSSIKGELTGNECSSNNQELFIEYYKFNIIYLCQAPFPTLKRRQ